MIPSFAASTLKPLMPVFMEKASQLRDKMLEVSQRAAIPSSAPAVDDEKKATEVGEKKVEEKVESGGGVVDVMALFGRAAMDIIGVYVISPFSPSAEYPELIKRLCFLDHRAGFDYDFNGLREEDNELAAAFRSMFNSFGGFGKLTVLARLLPKFLKPLIVSTLLLQTTADRCMI